MSTRPQTCDMTTGPQGPLSVPNIKNWGCEAAAGSNWDQAEDEGQTIDVRVDFYLNALPNPMSRIVTVSNTVSSKLFRNPSPTGSEDLIAKATVPTATAFTDCAAAWRAGTSKNDRQKRLANELLAAGIIDVSLGGTTA